MESNDHVLVVIPSSNILPTFTAACESFSGNCNFPSNSDNENLLSEFEEKPITNNLDHGDDESEGYEELMPVDDDEELNDPPKPSPMVRLKCVSGADEDISSEEVWRQNISEILAGGFHLLPSLATVCDLLLISGIEGLGKAVAIHKLVIASYSPMIAEQIKDHPQMISVVLPSVSQHIIKKVIQLLYTGEILFYNRAEGFDIVRTMNDLGITAFDERFSVTKQNEQVFPDEEEERRHDEVVHILSECNGVFTRPDSFSGVDVVEDEVQQNCGVADSIVADQINTEFVEEDVIADPVGDMEGADQIEFRVDEGAEDDPVVCNKIDPLEDNATDEQDDTKQILGEKIGSDEQVWSDVATVKLESEHIVNGNPDSVDQKDEVVECKIVSTPSDKRTIVKRKLDGGTVFVLNENDDGQIAGSSKGAQESPSKKLRVSHQNPPSDSNVPQVVASSIISDDVFKEWVKSGKISIKKINFQSCKVTGSHSRVPDERVPDPDIQERPQVSKIIPSTREGMVGIVTPQDVSCLYGLNRCEPTGSGMPVLLPVGSQSSGDSALETGNRIGSGVGDEQIPSLNSIYDDDHHQGGQVKSLTGKITRKVGVKKSRIFNRKVTRSTMRNVLRNTMKTNDPKGNDNETKALAVKKKKILKDKPQAVSATADSTDPCSSETMKRILEADRIARKEEEKVMREMLKAGNFIVVGCKEVPVPQGIKVDVLEPLLKCGSGESVVERQETVRGRVDESVVERRVTARRRVGGRGRNLRGRAGRCGRATRSSSNVN